MDVGMTVIDSATRGSIDYVCSDIGTHHLPFHDESFDLAILDAVIEHLQDPIRALRETHRVLRKGGNLLLSTPNQATLKNRVKLLLGGSIYAPLDQWLRSARIQKGNLNEFVGHIREYTIKEIRTILSLSGFKITSLRLYGVGMSAIHDSSQATFGANPSGSTGSDAIERLSEFRFLLTLYSLAEALVPRWRYRIALTATKR